MEQNMAKVLSRLDIILFANTAQYRSEIKDTQKDSKKLFDAIKKDAKEMSKVAATSFAATSAAAITATAAMVKQQVEMASELTRTARVANTSVQQMQKLAIAAKQVGIEQEKLGDIYKDTQDKIGDFLSTGGGEMADFFENIAPQIGVTAEQFRKLSGKDALQLYYDSVQKANLSTSEQIFYMEAVADEASALIPLLKDGGAGFKLWADAAENAGAIMDEKTIKATQELQASTELLKLSWQGAKNQFTQAIIPVLSDVSGELVSNANAADKARQAGEYFANTLKFVAKAGLGVIAVFDTVGKTIGAFAAAGGTLMEGVKLTDPVFLQQIKMAMNAKNAWQTLKIGISDVGDTLGSYGNAIARIDKLGSGLNNKMIQDVVALNQAQNEFNKTLGITGKEYQEQQKAAEEALKKQKIAAKAVNATVLAHAKKYDYAKLEKQYNLPSGLLAAISMQESRGNANATSPVGAKGEFQFMPATAKRFGIAGQERNTAKAAEAAAKYLSFLLKKFGSLDKAIMGYNAGEGNVANGRAYKFKETQNYLKNVKAYHAYMNGGIDGSVNINSLLENETQQVAQQLQKQHELRLRYADDVTKIELQLADDIANIKSANFTQDEEKKYIEQLTKQAASEILIYKNTQDKKLAEFAEFKLSETQLIKLNAGKHIADVKTDISLTEKQRQQIINLINERTQLELAKQKLINDRKISAMTAYRKSELEKIREQYEFERRQLELNKQLSTEQLTQQIELLNAQKNNDISKLQTDQRNGAVGLFAELTGNSGLFAIQNELETRKKIIDDALANEAISFGEHTELLKMIEKDAFEKRRQTITSEMEGIANSLTSITGNLLGKQSKAYRVMFAVEKGFAIARSIMAIQTGIAQAAALPFPTNLPAMASVAAATASIISNLQAVRQPNVVGQAHDGIANVPQEGTWLLDKGERVIKPKDNQKLTQFLEKQSQGQGLVVQINNYSTAKVEAKQDTDGQLKIMITDAINQQVPRQLANPNSNISKALKQNWQTIPRR